jgi:hypothetical protein
VNSAEMSNTESENERLISEYIAQKSRFVGAKEYEGSGKILIFNSTKVKPNHPGKYGNVVQYIVKEPSGIEREVNAGAVSLITGIQGKLREKPSGTDVKLNIKKTGVGLDTRYVVEHAN